jgi:HK97 family phage prohead protease
MGLLSRVFGRSPVVSYALETESRVAASFAVDSTSIPAQVLGLTSYSDPVAKAGPVTREIAIQVPAVKRARDLICATIGQLPAVVLNSKNVVTRNPLLDQPEAFRARVITMTLTVEDLLFYAKSYWQVTERVNGWPSKVKRLNPLEVDDGSGWPFTPEQRDLRTWEPGKVHVNGKHVEDRDLIRFESPNEALLYAGARAIRASLRLDASALNNADGQPPTDYFEPREGADPGTDAEILEILDAWKLARQRRSTAYVPAALKYNISGFDPQKLQLQEARQHAVIEIARSAGMDPEALGVSTTSRTYFNAFDKRKEFTDFVLSPYVTAVEERLSMGDVTPSGHKVRTDLDVFMRSDPKTRYETYEIGLRVGAIADQDEVRELEGKPPVEKTAEAAASAQDIARMAQQIYLAVPTVLTQEEARELLRSVGADLAELPTPSPEGTPPVTNTKFDAPDLAVTLDAAAPGATFKVNRETRTITGLAVPYGAVAESGGLAWSFSKGSLQYTDAKRVKLLVSHDWSRAIGYAAVLEDTDAGLLASFKVARGAAGDEALSMAEDGVWDGLSIGVAAGGRFDVRDGVNHAVAAPLVEISLTPAPAYDSARVTSVAAEAAHAKTETEAPVADETKTEAIEAPAVTASATEAVAPVVNTAVNFDMNAFAEALAKHLPAPAEAPVVIPAAAGEGVKAEPLPYRFDGRRGTHDFSTDLFAFARDASGEAGERIEKFMNVAFDVDSANVATLNPVRNRPDLYVGPLTYTTPLVDAVSKGTLADQIPFVLPKFGTSSGLVADHVEGTAPTAGTFTATSQTITPTAVSGKVEITREVIDAGGSPQVSGLIWAEMVNAYSEALENKVATMLDAASPTALATIAAGTVDAALADLITAGLVDLQFVKGGARMRDVFVHVDLFKALADATYTDGRKIFPLITPQNAVGSADADFGALQVGAYTFRPAWALGATGTGPNSSYLFNRGDVSQWASTPKRFSFDYRVELVDLAVWGYVAQGITRLDGVREIAYDPPA